MEQSQYPLKRVLFVLIAVFTALIQIASAQTISTQPVPSPQCPGSNLLVAYTTTGSFNPGNIFTAQLSDEYGSFTSPVNIGTGTSGGTIIYTIPGTVTPGTGYRIRVVSSNPVVNGTDNGSNITINPAPTVSLFAVPQGPVCPGTNVIYIATTNNTGSNSITYDFRVNGVSVQNGTMGTYMSSSINNGAIVTCVISTAICSGNFTTTSNAITHTTSNSITPTVSIETIPPGANCIGSMVVVVATAVGTSGGNVNYDFKINGVTIQSSGSNTFVAYGLVTGDQISCTLTIGGVSCLVTNTAYSNVITMAINAMVTPIVDLVSNQPGPICSGSPVTFTATGNNFGGGIPTYEFRINGAVVQSGASNIFITNALSDGDMVSCTMTITGGNCLTSNPVWSNSISTIVNPLITPAVTIIANPGNTLCSGSLVTFTATAVSNGSIPVNFDFMVNGASVQSGASNIFTTSTLANGDVVSCILTSSGTCLTSNTATSNLISMNISASLTPTVSINSSPAGPVCQGSPITITATVNNTGSGTVNYDFNVNGISVQNSSSNTFISSSLANGNTVTCTISVTGVPCLNSNTAISNTIIIAITSMVAPAVTLVPNPAGAICSGTSVTFTATATNTSGGTVIYDFRKNGISVQSSGSNVFSTSSLVTGDMISCTITISGGTCLSSNMAVSNILTMQVDPTVTPAVSLLSNQPSPLCNGTSVTFTASAINTAGGTVIYDFKLNGVSVQSSSSNTFTTSTLSNGDNISCEINVTGITCLTSNTSSSNVITVNVNPILTPAVTIAANPAWPVCSGTLVNFTATASGTGSATLNYHFYINGISVQNSSSPIFSSSSLADGDVITCTITATGGTCLSSNTAGSNTITAVINPNFSPTVSISSNQPGPICSGTSVTFTATALNTGAGTIIYTFNKNGIPVQSNGSNLYTTSSLVNGDVVSCSISVSGEPCLSSNSASSNSISIVVNPNLTPTLSIIADQPGPVCAGTSVTFTATAVSTAGGTLTYDFKINGTSVQSSASNTFTTSTLSNGDNISCVINITGGTCLTSNTSSSNVITVNVNPILTPAVTIAANPAWPVCSGTLVNFTATASGTGSATLNYHFYINGISVQNSSSPIFSSSSLADGDVITCTITATGGNCLSSNTAGSNTITAVINPNFSPAVSISSNPPGPICSGTSVTFTATALNTGAGTIIYTFNKNGIPVQSNGSNLYTTSSLVNGDVVSCSISVSGEPCLSSNSASSNSISIVVNPNLTPTLSIIADQPGPVCAGTSLTFTATAVSTAGGTLIYDFKINGTTVQSSTSNTFTTSTLSNGDNISCEINITGGTCLTSNTAISNIITVFVNPLMTATNSISVLPAGPVCVGTAVTFTATATNTGTASIIYNFMVNGNSVQSSASNTFTTNTLTNGDAITCIITLAGGTCLTSNSALSNSITAEIIPLLTPSLSLTSSPAGPICAGTPINFVATSLNTGSGTVIYDFKINGASVQTGTNSSYTCSTLNNGDNISCTIIMSGGCLTSNTVNSNSITVTVMPLITPTINLAVLPAGPVCAGSQLIFTATAGSTGGGTENFDFKVNGSSVQSGNSPLYSTSALSNGDIVTCTLSLTGGTCLTTNNVSSTPITAAINPNITPSVSMAVDQPGPVCLGTRLTFTAQAVNSGTGSIMYDFRKNGNSVQNSSSNSYETTTLANGDIITCQITVTGGSCLVSNTANSNPVSVILTAGIAPAINISIQPAGPVCAGIPVSVTATPSNTNGGSVNYDFKVNGISKQSGSSNVFTSSTFSTGDDVRCDITVSGATCLTQSLVISNEIEINVNPTFTPSVSLAFVPSVPVCPGTMIRYTATAANTGSAAISYEFKINGMTVQSGPTNTYASDLLKSNDRVTCVINLSGGSCLTANTVTSADVKPDISNEACPNKFYIPTGFTPNQDGRNDLFRPLIFGKVVSYRFAVYNRWGQKVFESTDMKRGWDGKQFGTQSDSNVFVWVCTFQFDGGQPEIRKGTVVLIR